MLSIMPQMNRVNSTANQTSFQGRLGYVRNVTELLSGELNGKELELMIKGFSLEDAQKLAREENESKLTEERLLKWA